MTFIIAIDGPAASGKGTIAKSVAAKLSLSHFDTGLLYRAVAAFVLDQRIDVSDVASVHVLLEALDLSILESLDLHTQAISKMASVVAANPLIREALLEVQRNFALGKEKLIVEGRDIGTVIFPNADLKIYITADLEERVDRRLKQLQMQGEDTIRERVLKDIEERDARDLNRSCAPLLMAGDYQVVNTTGLSIESSINKVLSLVVAAVTPSLS